MMTKTQAGAVNTFVEWLAQDSTVSPTNEAACLALITLLKGARASLMAGYGEDDIDRLWPAIRRAMEPRFGERQP